MTSRCALYVDAGYLLASAATRVTGSSLRGIVNVDYGSLVDQLVQQAQELSGLPVLRVNWYDSGGRPGGQADHEQEVLGMLPRVKLRLGRRSPTGEQKGVDVRLGLDLATHGRNHVADVMYLVSGDDDLTEAVEEAQGHGVQVVVLAVPDREGKAHGVARHLVREADGVEVIAPHTIDSTVHRPVPVPARAVIESSAEGENGQVVTEPPSPTRSPEPTPATHEASSPARPRPSDLAPRRVARDVTPQPLSSSVLAYSSTTGHSPTGTLATDDHHDVLSTVCRKVYDAWRVTASPDQQHALLAGRPYIPGHIDRALLMDTSDHLGIYELDERTRVSLRKVFWEVIV